METRHILINDNIIKVIEKNLLGHTIERCYNLKDLPYVKYQSKVFLNDKENLFYNISNYDQMQFLKTSFVENIILYNSNNLSNEDKKKEIAILKAENEDLIIYVYTTDDLKKPLLYEMNKSFIKATTYNDNEILKEFENSLIFNL